MSKFVGSDSRSIPSYETGHRNDRLFKGSAIEWFTFSVVDRQDLWWDPFWWTSLLLEVGFVGFTITSFIVLLQVEQVISRAWIFWIFYLIQTGLLALHTFIYAYVRLYRLWINMSIHHVGRIYISMCFTWAAIIFSIAALSQFISLDVVPPCCTSDIAGLTAGPLDIPLFLHWQLIMALVFSLNFAASLANLVSIQSQLYPERKLSEKELRELPRVFFQKKRRDHEEQK